MTNARGKELDNTHLSVDQAEDRGFIHRDYIAHCHRWSHVCKWLNEKRRYKDAVILDVGCGKEIPLAKLLYSSRLIPKHYIGVDYNKKLDMSPFHTGKFPITALGGITFPDVSVTGTILNLDLGHPNVAVSFEVIEHVEPEAARCMLEGIFDIINQSDGDFFLSTPCYDERVGAAGNHVSEITRDALGAVLEDLGFAVEGNWGTFASIRDYQDHLEEDGHLELFKQLRSYYDVNVLATIFAPLYPQYSRNNLWHLKVADESYSRLFPHLVNIDTPWTSSDKWKDLAG